MNRLLLIDSRQEALDALAASLEGGAFSIRKAKRYEAALTEAKRFNPELILLAVQSENPEGLEILTKLKGREETAKTPVFCLADPSAMARCLSEGAAECLPEPVDGGLLAKRIMREIESSNGLRERDELITALKDRVAERTAELASLRRRLLLINDSKDLALRLVVRELSAPATGIAGIARIALLECADVEKRERLSALLTRNAETMDRLIANAEYLGTLKTGIAVSKRVPADMAPVVAEAMERVSERIAEKGLETRFVFPGDRAELPLHPELFAQMITPVLRLATALAIPATRLIVESESNPEWSSIAVCWTSSETNQGIVANVTDFASDLLRSINGFGLITEICLAEKIARIYDGTVVWDLRDAERATCTVQFDRAKATESKKR